MTAVGVSRLPDPPAEAAWLLGPGAVAWDVMRNPAVVVLGILREGLVNALSLPFATATVEHDRHLFSDPIRRFRRATRWFVTATFGTREEIERYSRGVRIGHTKMTGIEPVTGLAYDASSQELLALAHVFAWGSFLAIYELLEQPLEPDRRDQFLREAAVVSTMVGLRPELAPQSSAELDRFLARARTRFAIGEHSRSLLIPFGSGRFAPGTFLGDLSPAKRAALAPVLRIFVDVALATIDAEDRALLAIDRPAQLRSERLVRGSGRALVGLLGREEIRARFEQFVDPALPAVMARARAAETALDAVSVPGARC